MFLEARIKLTAWYVLVIMLVSMFFSAVIYRVIGRELEQGIHRAELRYQQRWGFFIPPPDELNVAIINELKAAKRRMLWRLILANGVILVFSAGSGYFLAGKTLRPIETALEEQKRFVDDASHELRTPLTALKTTIEVALRDKSITLQDAKATLRSNLEDIHGLELLTNNLLSLTRNGYSHRAWEEVDIARTISLAVKKISPLARRKKITISIVGPKDIKLRGNPASLEEMVLIFLDNAVKYTPPKGRVKIVVASDKNYLALKISDSGIGIAAGDIPHIFDRFYRVDQSRSNDNVPGFGLGLSLAQKIIDMHRGSVAVDSQIKKGTVFNIRLPLDG